MRGWETSTKGMWVGDKGTPGINGVRTIVMLRSIVASFTVVITVLTSIGVSRCFDTLTEVFRDFSQL